MKVSLSQEMFKLETMQRRSFVVTFVIEHKPLTKAQIISVELVFPSTNRSCKTRYLVKQFKLIVERAKLFTTIYEIALPERLTLQEVFRDTLIVFHYKP